MRQAPQRLHDVLRACDAIATYLERDPAIEQGITFDAVRMNIVIIGEAVKGLPDDLLAREPGIPWAAIARMRDRVAHRYFDTAHAVVAGVARNRIPELCSAVERLLAVESDFEA